MDDTSAFGTHGVGRHSKRRVKTSAERAAQRRRAEARTVQELLAGFNDLAAHRGSALSKAAQVFVSALATAANIAPNNQSGTVQSTDTLQ